MLNTVPWGLVASREETESTPSGAKWPCPQVIPGWLCDLWKWTWSERKAMIASADPHDCIWIQEVPVPLEAHTQNNVVGQFNVCFLAHGCGVWHVHLHNTRHSWKNSVNLNSFYMLELNFHESHHCGWWSWKVKRILIQCCWRRISIIFSLPVSWLFGKFITPNWMWKAKFRTLRVSSLSSHCIPKPMPLCVHWTVIL